VTQSSVRWAEALGQRMASQMPGVRERATSFMLGREGSSTPEYAVTAAIIGAAIIFALSHLKRH
jgi:Flp pilus assembly pilin Flp